MDFEKCRFDLNLAYTTRSWLSWQTSCSGPRPTVVLSTRYKLEGDNYVDWTPVLAYTAG